MREEEERRREEEERRRRWHSYVEEAEEESDADNEEKETSDEERSAYVGRLLKDGSYGDGLGRLARHETTLMNAFTKTMQMLLLLQENRKDRKGDPVMLEAVALPEAA